MAKAGAKIEKIASKKKVNHYSKDLCEKELARLETIKDFNSKYQQDIRAQLKTLAI